MGNFKVGMCSHNGPKDFSTPEVLPRFRVLKSSIETCFGNTLDANTLYCFVAPEFFFGSEALPKSEYHKLLNLCRSLYAAQNLILVPGSMVSYSGSMLPHKKSKFANRVPIFYGGQLLTYEKQTEGGEKPGTGGVGSFRQGRSEGQPGLFKINFAGKCYTFVVEVCMEHDLAIAKEKYTAIADVHIITSNSVTFKENNAIGAKFTLHCDAKQSKLTDPGAATSKVYGQYKKEIPPTTNQQNVTLSWDLTLD